MAGQQQEEIETIRSRTIEVKLSDADVKRISEKAAAHGLTVGELIENFIGDLVCGTYSNGSDERMYFSPISGEIPVKSRVSRIDE